MIKHMKKAVSFFMAVCLLAGNSYVNTEANTSVTMGEWTEVNQELSDAPKPLLAKGLLNYLENKVRTVSAEETTPTPGVTEAPTTPGIVEGQRVAFMHPDKTNEFILEGDAPIEFSDSKKLIINGIGEDGKPCPISNNITITNVTESEPGIVSITQQGNENQQYIVELTALAPGCTQISAHVEDKEKNLSYNIVCMVRVKLEVDRSLDNAQAKWKTVDKVDKKVLVFESMDSAGYTLKLAGVQNKDVNNTFIEWVGTNNGIVDVDESTGTIKPLSAGSATITLLTKKNSNEKPKEEAIDIVVVPLGSVKEDGQLVRDPAPSSKPYYPGGVSSFTLYTNGNPASNIDWKVYSLTYDGLTGKANKEKEIKANATNDLLTWTAGENENDRNLYFTDVKAGTYKVVGLSTVDKKYENENWNKIEFNVVVDLNLSSVDVVYMNIDDSYSIAAKTNVPAELFNELWKATTSGSPSSNIASLQDGVVTAKRKGTYVVDLAYNKESKYSIYPLNNKNCDVSKKITLNISDEVMLNESVITLAKDAQYQLEFMGYGSINATEIESATWSSSDDKYVKVDPNSGLVTALKATNDNYVTVTLTVLMKDGIKKTATCRVYVQEAISNITMEPESETIEIGETIWITAKPDSAPLGAKVHFKVSDPTVVKLAEQVYDFSIQITGLKGGTAEVVAITPDNVVVGFCTITVLQEATGVQIRDFVSPVKLSLGSLQLYADVLPATATNKKITWKSKTPSIATIDPDTGLVTFKKAGQAIIIAEANTEDGVQYDMCTIVIQDIMEKIELDADEIEMYVGETRRLSYQIDGNKGTENIGNKNLVWTSFDTSVAAVDKTGMVTAKGPGTTHIMVMSEENGSCFALCKVVVKQKATSVKMNYKELTMNRGEYFDMEVTIAPVNATEASLIWESLNPKVATVASNGRITARAEGTAIIAVRTQNGNTSYCTVNVIEPVISLELDPTDIIIDVGEIFQIDPVFKPVAPTIQDVKWTSYDTDIATVNALGEIEGISRGATIVTCETVDGGYRAFCLIQVLDPAMIVTVTPDNYRLGHGKSITLEASVTNHGKPVENMPLLWESSNEDIATVDEYGKVTGVGYGYATIRVEVDDDYGAYATCEIRVVREVTSIKLNHNVLTIIQGHTASLKADIQPSNATYTDAIFSSDDEAVAVVDEDGVITAIEPGTTWIWAKAKDNSGKYARCYVTVIKPIPATGITVSDKQVVLIAGETKSLVYTVKPTNTTDDVTWTSGNEAIATVDGDGVITARRTGTAIVTAMTTSGKMAQVEVIVLGLNRTSLELPIYTKYSRLSVDGATGTIRWDVEDQSICEVRNGEITARKAGTTYVTATVNGRTLRCKVTVTPNKKKK